MNEEERKKLVAKMEENRSRGIPNGIFDLKFYREYVTNDAKSWVEGQFPVEHYGEQILTYEAWGMRALLEMAYMAGKAGVTRREFLTTRLELETPVIESFPTQIDRYINENSPAGYQLVSFSFINAHLVYFIWSHL